MIITKDDEDTIHELGLLSGVSEEDIRKVFEAFLIQFTFKYTASKRVQVPFVGNFLVRYRSDEVTLDGLEAQVDAFYAPHPQINRIVGQLKDCQITGDYTKLDTFTSLKNLVKHDFKMHITDDVVVL